MALKQFIYLHQGCPLASCKPNKFELEVGEQVQIKLDPKNPTWRLAFTADVIAVGRTSHGRHYTLQYDDVVLGTNQVMFEGCDIKSLKPYCCCDKLNDELDTLENRVVVLEAATESVRSVALTENAATGVITLTVTSGTGAITSFNVQDSTLTLDPSGNLVNPAGAIIVPSSSLKNVQFSAPAANGSVNVTVNGVNVATIPVDTDTKYAFGAGAVTDSNGLVQPVSASSVTTSAIDGVTIVKNGSGAIAVNAAALGIPSIPSTYADQNIVTSGLPAPLAAAATQEAVNIIVANTLTSNAPTELLQNAFGTTTLGYIKP